jgi:hypothetical protein
MAFAVVGLVILALLAAAWRWLPALLREEQTLSGDLVTFPQFDCRYLKPEPPWETEDATIRHSLKALLVMQRTAPTSFLALLAKDYKNQAPTDAEVQAEALRRLGDYFNKDNLEWEEREPGQLAGQPAQRLVFRGETAGHSMSGECDLLIAGCRAYVFLAWAPADQVQTAAQEFPELLTRFSLLSKTKAPAPRESATKSFGSPGLPYVVDDDSGLWDRWTPPTDFDPAAVLALVARDRDETGKVRSDRIAPATALILVLKPGHADLAAAVKAARGHLEAQQKELYPQTTFEPVGEESTGKVDHVGTEPGQILRLHVQNAEKRQRFFQFGVVRRPEQTVVVQCECSWEQREAWQPRFDQLLGSLHPRDDHKERTAQNHGGDKGGP